MRYDDHASTCLNHNESSARTRALIHDRRDVYGLVKLFLRAMLTSKLSIFSVAVRDPRSISILWIKTNIVALEVDGGLEESWEGGTRSDPPGEFVSFISLQKLMKMFSSEWHIALGVNLERHTSL